MSLTLVTLAIALIAAWAALLPGMFLVLRGNTLVSDGIGHAVVAGIAVGFILTHDVHSVVLLILAALVGVATVALTEYLYQSRALPYDAALGTVYPLFFSIGIILITMYARSVHLDIDMVILGDIVYAPFDRLFVHGLDWGPRALWTCGILASLVTGAAVLAWCRIGISVLDEEYARVMGLHPWVYIYLAMVVTSVTAVTTFAVFGAIVVVGMMAIPPAIAYMWSRSLTQYVAWSIGIAATGVCLGYGYAAWADVSIIGSIVGALGCLWLISIIIHPERGVIRVYMQQWIGRAHTYEAALYTALRVQGQQHATYAELQNKLLWHEKTVKRIAQRLAQRGIVSIEGDTIHVGR